LPEADQKKLSSKELPNLTVPRIGYHHFFNAIILWIFGGNLIWILLDIRSP